MRVLVVEDDRDIARLVELALGQRGFEVRCAYDGPSGLEAAREWDPAVVILDIMLPKMDGVGVLKRLRSSGNKVPIIMMTARDTTPDKVHSLDHGADDYLTKPFDIEELLARLRALLRRAEGDEVLRVADLTINHATREVRRGEREIDLTAKEFALLAALMQRPGQVFSRSVLLDTVWGVPGEVSTSVVELYISYLRRKLDRNGEPSR
ncbi:MAG: response regulator transcription factor, partial [Rubrobacter sp.]|nr:response regulator transcription factor [Rubrobacter sp.]